MIILDTTVISAIMAPASNRVVTNWLDRQPRNLIWTTVISVFEVRFGIELLEAGRRRDALQAQLEDLLELVMHGNVLPFDREAAYASARLSAQRRRTGRVVGGNDTQIAGIALARRATLATRNIRHFDDIALPLVDPWSA